MSIYIRTIKTRIGCYEFEMNMVASHTIGEVPPNNHGIKPQVLISQEQKVISGALLTTIPTMSTEWTVTYDVRINEGAISSSTVIHFTNRTDNLYGPGYRIPFMGIFPNSRTLHICSTVNGYHNYSHNFGSINVNQTYHVEIHQRYISNGEYHYFIMIDGLKVESVINNSAMQFHDVKVYASNTFDPSADAYVGNLKFTNFL